jgi:hypothetical protein
MDNCTITIMSILRDKPENACYQKHVFEMNKSCNSCLQSFIFLVEKKKRYFCVKWPLWDQSEACWKDWKLIKYLFCVYSRLGQKYGRIHIRLSVPLDQKRKKTKWASLLRAIFEQRKVSMTPNGRWYHGKAVGNNCTEAVTT